MHKKLSQRIKAAAVSTAIIASALITPSAMPPLDNLGLSDTPLTAKAAETLTIDQMPDEYKYAADWIWENRISKEDSLGMSKDRWNNLFDQIIAGNGTLNYVVKWQSYKDLTLDTRQKFQSLVYDTINEWNDWLAGYESWPYDEVDVNIVGYTLIDEADFIDPQPGEIIWAGEQYLHPYDPSYDTSNGREEIPTVEPLAPDEYWSFNYFWDRNHQYPEIRFDMYLWCTQGFPDFGGCGGDWGQRFADDVYIEMANTRSNVSLQLHELGHAFGMTDFYGAEGAADGYPPGGFPDGNSIMWVNSANFAISDFDGWMLRYIWTHIKDEEGRFNLPDVPVVTTTTTATTLPPVQTTTTTSAPDIVEPSDSVETDVVLTDEGYWMFNANGAVSADIHFEAPAAAGANGAFGYWNNEWVQTGWEGTFSEDGKLVINLPLPAGVGDVQIHKYWAQAWDNALQSMADCDVNIAKVVLNYSDAPSTETTTTTSATTTTTTTTSETTTTETTTVDLPELLIGDANCNGTIEVADAVFILQGIADPGNSDFMLSDEGCAKADADGNGGVDAQDALAIQMFKAGMIDSLPTTE